jgi:ABC-2 type transport system ATP-binding protein
VPVTAAVELRDVTVRRGRIVALEELSLSAPEGQVVGIVGPNGAGKTTLVDVACGLLRPDRGEVRVLGQDVRRDGRAVRRQIGLIPQETALYEEVSAWRNLRLAAELYGVRPLRPRIAEVLELVGLEERAQDPVSTYSGGMRRRLAIARALLHQPRLLILDEPTLGVDVEGRHQIWAHVRGLRARGHSVLISTNYMDEAEALCDRVAVLRRGRLVAEDSPQGLIERAGRCVDLECGPEAALELRGSLVGDPAVARVELTEAGLTLYVKRGSPAEAVARRAMDQVPVTGFRVRSPDLAEVFRALDE